MQRYLFELTAWFADRGVERWSTLVSDEWVATELRRDPNLDRVVTFEPGYFPLGAPPVVHPLEA